MSSHSSSPTTPDRYPLLMRALHWLMALCILGALGLGFFLDELPSDWRAGAWRLHKSLGLSALMLLPLRMILRLRGPLPALHGTRHERLLAHGVHRLLYVAMALITLSGYLMLAAKGKVPVWFGIDLPILVSNNPALAKLARHWHEPFAYFLLALLALHIAGLLKHHFIDRRAAMRPML